MSFAAPAYCAESDVLQIASRWNASTTALSARIASAIQSASIMVEQQTNLFFEQRTLQVDTQAAVPGQRRLFLPHPIISLTSVMEGGAALSLSSVVVYDKWLEKSVASPPNPMGCGVGWSQAQLAQRIVGVFGYASTPADVVQATAFLAAMQLGMVERQYIANDGSQSASLMLKAPDWVQTILKQRSAVGLTQQPFNILRTA